MKEWLLKTEDGKYHYHRDDMDCCPKHVEKIEIPEGAEIAIKFNIDDMKHGICFYKNSGKLSWSKKEPCWQDSEWSQEELLDESFKHGNIDLSHKVLWQRQEIFIDESEIINEEVKSLDDKVNQPNHYANFSIECIDAMQAMLSREEFIGYLRGNIFKYQWRYKLKNGVEDLKKAQWYQNKLIEVEENE